MTCKTPAVDATLSLANYTSPELIVARLRESDPAGIIEELTHRLHTHDIVEDVLSFYHAVLNQEFLSNSATPYGIALPHARSLHVARLTVAIGRTSEPVVWGTKGSWPVECVLLIASPSTDASEYLPLLSSIAGFGRQPECLARLNAALDARSIFDLLKGIKVR